jgi:hypothetical protein
VRHDLTIGCAATAIAVSVPDTVLSLVGKVLFAVFTAALSSLVSYAVTKWLKARGK